MTEERKREKLAEWCLQRMTCRDCPLKLSFKCGRGTWFTTKKNDEYTMLLSDINNAYEMVFGGK